MNNLGTIHSWVHSSLTSYDAKPRDGAISAESTTVRLTEQGVFPAHLGLHIRHMQQEPSDLIAGLTLQEMLVCKKLASPARIAYTRWNVE